MFPALKIGEKLVKGEVSILAKNAAKQFLSMGIDALLGSGITLTNNEVKDIIKVINSIENRWDSLKVSSCKIIIQELTLLNFLGPLMGVGLLLMNNALTTLVKIVLVPLRLVAVTTSKNSFLDQVWLHALIISNEKMDDIMKMVKSFKNTGLSKWA